MRFTKDVLPFIQVLNSAILEAYPSIQSEGNIVYEQYCKQEMTIMNVDTSRLIDIPASSIIEEILILFWAELDIQNDEIRVIKRKSPFIWNTEYEE